jgi:hypothetical protein
MTAPCEYGRFYTLCEDLIKPIADYAFKQYTDYLTATVKGACGRVVIYFGDHHVLEVWYFAKGDREGTLVGSDCYVSRERYEHELAWWLANGGRHEPTYLPDVLDKAMGMAGVPRRLI